MAHSSKKSARADFAGEYLSGLKKCIDALPLDSIASLIEALDRAYDEGRQVFIMGNGGSAATASHMAADLLKTILPAGRMDMVKRFRVISLTDNVAWMTAIGNDLGYVHLFSEQLKNYAREGDLVIAITGSGNSPNILEGMRVAKSMGAEVVGILGFDGGKAKALSDRYVLVESNSFGFVEDLHMVLNHLVTAWFSAKNREQLAAE